MAVIRRGWLVLALAVLLLSTTVAYAFSPQLRQLFLHADTGLLYIEQANLGQELSLTQTVEGLTINVSRVYADGNRIIVGYSVSGSSLTNDSAMAVTLTDEAGTSFPVFEVRSSAVQDATRAFVATFDAGALQVTPTTLHLTIEPGEVQRASNPQDESAWHAVAAPVTFDLRMQAPVARQVIDLRQTAEVAGITLVLEQVSISPSGVHAILCDDPSDGEATPWLSAGTLATGAGTRDRVQSEASAIGTEGCHILRFPASHYSERDGEWTLTVTTLTEPDHQQGKDRQVSGTWTFHFNVPRE